MSAQLTNTQILLKECIAKEFSESVGYRDEASFFEFFAASQTSLDKGTQRKTTENELPSLTQCTA